jgi:tetratricopeptide (TPR) repeat protein
MPTGKRATVASFDALVTPTEALKDKVKAGQFDELGVTKKGQEPKLVTLAKELVGKCRTLGDSVQVLTDEHPRERYIYYSSLSWSAAVYEYFGQTAEIRDLIQHEGQRLHGSFQSSMRGPLITEEEPRHHARQQVWILLHYANLVLFRERDYGTALEVINLCELFVKSRFDMVTFPCHYLRAQIASERGAIQRHLGKMSLAEEEFRTALGLIHDRVKDISKREKDPERVAQEQTRASFEAAKILALGIGGCQLTTGLLREAAVSVRTALVMLWPTGDILRKAHARLLLSSIERALAGLDPKRLVGAIEQVDDGTESSPYRVFERYGHKRYRSRADYALSLANLYLANHFVLKQDRENAADHFMKALRHIDEVLSLSFSDEDRRWECVSLIVKSRIARGLHTLQEAVGNGSVRCEALDLAERAVTVSNSISQDLEVVCDAQIACGEAHLLPSRVDFEKAVSHFGKALRSAGDNAKTAAVCHLHLVRAFLGDDQVIKAHEHLRICQRLNSRVQHGLVREMTKAVEAEFEARRRPWLFISTEQQLNYDFHDRQLRKFLLHQAEARNETVDAIAASIGIKRATYYKWTRELKVSDVGKAKGKSAKA